MSTTPNVMQPQQRPATSAHVTFHSNRKKNYFLRFFKITITAAQLQQILNASQKPNNNATVPKAVQQSDNNNQSSDETTTVEIKQQPV
jgi:hypothetical protein